MRKLIALLATTAVFIVSVLGVSAFNSMTQFSGASFQVIEVRSVGEFTGRITQVDADRSLVIAVGMARFTEGPPQLLARDLPAQIGLVYERAGADRPRLTGEGFLILRVELPSGRKVSLSTRLRDLEIVVERFAFGAAVSIPLITDEFWGPGPSTADPGRATLDRLSTDFSETMIATLERFLDVTLEPGDILTELAMTDLPSPTPGDGGPNPDEPGGGGSDPPIATPRPPNT